MAVSSLWCHENQDETTHVESTLVPRLDEGSSPSSSTSPPLNSSDFGAEAGAFFVPARACDASGGGEGVVAYYAGNGSAQG